jgi:ribosomal protein L37AE/L43A
MKKNENSNKGLQNRDIELRKSENTVRTVKSCPFCHSTVVSHRKWKGDYWCRNCQESFKGPVFKQIKDRRNELPVPPTLRRQHLTEQTDEIWG